MKLMGSTLVCEYNIDGLVVRYCDNKDTTERECPNTNNMTFLWSLKMASFQ